MATLTITNIFTNATTAVASQVNTNFTDVSTFINSNAIQKDGSQAMTGALTLSGLPTLALHAASKSYVDGAVPTALSTYVPAIRQNNQTITSTTTYAKYVQIGPLATVWYHVVATAAGPGGPIDISLPVNHGYTGSTVVGMGGGRFLRPLGFSYVGEWFNNGGDQTRALMDFSTLVSVPVVASGDVFSGVLSYSTI